MKKGYVRFILILFLFLDTIFSFVQHYNKSLDGDIASIVLGYPEVMHDPFGMNVILKHEVYGGTNRFFAHWMMSVYFKTVPVLLQAFFSPIESIYISCAIAKTTIQVAIIILLAFFISHSKKITDVKFLIAVTLIFPLIQTEGYGNYMGLINSSITYTFFYSLPTILLMIFYFPILKRLLSGTWQKMKPIFFVFLLLLTIVIALDGPLSPALLIIISSLIILNNFIKNRRISIKEIPSQILVLLICSILFSLYSLYLGQFNAENFFKEVSLLNRYELLPLGLFNSFTQKLGLPLLLIVILINLFLIVKSNPEKNYILKQSKWLLLFTVIYLLLLPLGGYREYRPNIVRSDTLIPVLICMIYLFGVSSYYLINNLSSGNKPLYLSLILIVLLIFTVADKSISNENSCEINSLTNLSNSEDKIIHLDGDCNVMSWYRMKDLNNSKLNCELLLRWNVIKEPKMYYQD